MKKQTWITASDNPITPDITDSQANRGWNKFQILKAGDLDGTLKKDSAQSKIMSDEICNVIESANIVVDPTDSTQLNQAIDAKLAEIKTSSLQFKGYVSTVEPSSDVYGLNVGNMWLNMADMPTEFPVPAESIKIWNGNAWEDSTSTYYPEDFHTFKDVDNNEGFYWFGGQWQVLSTDLSTEYFYLNQNTGLWEIKDNVNLPGTPTVDTPADDATGREIVNAEWVLSHSSQGGGSTSGTASLPLFTPFSFPFKAQDISYVCSDYFSWLYRSVYVSAYDKLVNQVHPKGKFKVGETTFYIVFSDGDGYATDVALDGNVSELKDWAVANGFTHNGETTVSSLEVYKTIVPETEEIDGISITFYRTFNEMKITTPEYLDQVVDMYSSTGVALYFILDEENARFKLPRTKYEFTGFRDIVGNYVPESLPNIKGSATVKNGVGTTGDGNAGFGDVSGAFKLGKSFSAGRVFTTSSVTRNINQVDFDAGESSSVYQDNAPVQQRATQSYLYFYLGQADEEELKVIASSYSDTINNKADRDLNNIPSNIDYVIDSQLPTAENNYTWYRVYKSGLVEQGGIITSETYSTTPANFQTTITFNKQFKDNNYIKIITPLTDFAWNVLLQQQNSIFTDTGATLYFNRVSNTTAGVDRYLQYSYEFKGISK